jgi:hypothetical protein
MARAISAPADATTQPSPYAEDNLLLEDVIEAVGRGFIGDELLDHLAEVAGVHYAAAVRVTPHRTETTVPRTSVTDVRPDGPPRDPFAGEIGAARYFGLNARFLEGEPGARRCKWADPDQFLGQVGGMS